MLKFDEDSLYSFMNSVMNIEYVYLILLGIQCMIEQSQDIINSQHLIASSISKNEVKDASKKRIKIIKDKETSQITFCNIQYLNVKLWNAQQVYLPSEERLESEQTQKEVSLKFSEINDFEIDI